MPIQIGNIGGFDVYAGNVEIGEGYVGTVLIFSNDGGDNGVVVLSNSANLTSTIFTFNQAHFTNGFDAGGNPANKVNIKSLPNVPQLKYLGDIISVGFIFPVANSSGLKFVLSDNYAVYNGIAYLFEESLDVIIQNYSDLGYVLSANSNGSLTFTNQSDETDMVTVSGTVVDNADFVFSFTTTDSTNSPSNIAQFTLIPTGNINVKALTVNQPPSQVGDTLIAVEPSGIYTYSVADFTTKSTPNYKDPENDDAYELLVVTLPPIGKLQLRGVDVVAEQILSFANDIATGDFKFVPDPDKLDAYTEWSSKISDYGSKTFIY